MPLTKRHRVIIADDEFDDVHGLVDTAAALVTSSYDTTELARSADLLRAALQHHPTYGFDIADPLTSLFCASEDAIRNMTGRIGRKR